jgi:hypothetical protein
MRKYADESMQDGNGFGMAEASMDVGWGAVATFGGWVGFAGGVGYFGTTATFEMLPGVRNFVVNPIVDKVCAIAGRC